MDTMGSTYQTTNLDLATALWTAGADFIRAEAMSHRTVVFVFGPLALCEAVSDKFWNDALTVNAKDFTVKQRALKDVLFTTLRDRNGEKKWNPPNGSSRTK